MSTTIKTRIVQKHDTTTNWKNSDFVPLAGELIIYDSESPNIPARSKLGDGVTPINELPFTDEAVLITTADIDTICGMVIQDISGNGDINVTF